MYSQERTFVHNDVYIQISNLIAKEDSLFMNQLWEHNIVPAMS